MLIRIGIADQNIRKEYKNKTIHKSVGLHYKKRDTPQDLNKKNIQNKEQDATARSTCIIARWYKHKNCYEDSQRKGHCHKGAVNNG